MLYITGKFIIESSSPRDGTGSDSTLINGHLFSSFTFAYEHLIGVGVVLSYRKTVKVTFSLEQKPETLNLNLDFLLRVQDKRERVS